MGKLLFLPMATENQFRMCNSIAEKIIEMYGDRHEIYVAVGKDWEAKLHKMCPSLKIATFRHPNDQLQREWIARTGKNKSEILAKLCEEYVQIWNDPQTTDMVDTMANFYENFLNHICKIYPFVTKIIQDLKPDFIIQNFQLSTPVGVDQGIPYALLQTCSPTFFGSGDLPPPMSDLPSEPTMENRKLWSEFFDQAHLLRHCDLKVKFNNWLKAHRCPNLDERMYYLVESPYLNIQLYPEPLDYDVELPGKWVKLQSAVCTSTLPKPIDIPDKLRNLPGKLIYINLGYNQIIYSFVLNKLLNILPHINHRFIVSMDLDNDQIAPNMYASNEIDSSAVLQVADLVIYHAGTKLMCGKLCSFYFIQ